MRLLLHPQQKTAELGALIAALHRTNQLGYPIMIVGAGLPRIYKMLSDEKSYSERLFMYRTISSLTDEHCRKAIEEPAKKMCISYTDTAIKEIIDITKGDPFFIQQMCQVVYNNTEDETIHDIHVKENIAGFFELLDVGFFKVRYER